MEGHTSATDGVGDWDIHEEICGRGFQGVKCT